jgi:hypothetical protein
MIDGRPQTRVGYDVTQLPQCTVDAIREEGVRRAAELHGERCEARRLANRREA